MRSASEIDLGFHGIPQDGGAVNLGDDCCRESLSLWEFARTAANQFAARRYPGTNVLLCYNPGWNFTLLYPLSTVY